MKSSELVGSSCSFHTSDTQSRSSRFRHPHSLPRLPVEADVNVLVVGSGTARRGAIGRHFPFPLIRRCLKPVLRRWLLRFLRAKARQARLGEGPTDRSRGNGVGKTGCVYLGGWWCQPSVSLLIWRTSASRADSPGPPISFVYLHQHGGQKPPPPGPQKGVGLLRLFGSRPQSSYKGVSCPPPITMKLLRPRLRTGPPTPPRTQISQSRARGGCELWVGRTNPKGERRKTTSPTENRVVRIIIA